MTASILLDGPTAERTQSDLEGPLVLDLDDFCEANQGLAELDALREQIGVDFRVSLFTIPGLSSPGWLEDVRRLRPWIELIPHGAYHETSRECERWSRNEMRQYLYLIRPLMMVKGWKAPGWQLNAAIYDTLLEHGYWVADHVENRGRRPAGLQAYELDEPRKIHGHIGHMGGHNPNELSLIYQTIVNAHSRRVDRGANSAFGFASRELRRTGTL